MSLLLPENISGTVRNSSYRGNHLFFFLSFPKRRKTQGFKKHPVNLKNALPIAFIIS